VGSKGRAQTKRQPGTFPQFRVKDHLSRTWEKLISQKTKLIRKREDKAQYKEGCGKETEKNKGTNEVWEGNGNTGLGQGIPL